uniref:coiled-coil domain-containing protein 122 n=1 Tax=Doryrhamphus excisus TaxID=161450 RepID=UPI0025ADA8A9|nr:coiled-coil domain-containing protein 122 [Doryrhamphus excisus]
MAACADEGQNQLSLTQALENVSQHGYTQTAVLQENQMILSSLQVTLADLQKTGDEAEKKLRCEVAKVLFLENEMMHLKQEMQARHDQCAAIRADNTKLLEQISEAEEKACTSQTQFDIYRTKMNDHRLAILHAAGLSLVCKELEERKALVQRLRKAKEELKEDVKNPQGSTVLTAKREVDALKEEIAAMKKTISERRENLQKELQTHAEIKKDIEIQNKRFEAMVKYFRRQLSRARAFHGQMSTEIADLKRQIAELKRKVGSSNGSVVSDE